MNEDIAGLRHAREHQNPKMVAPYSTPYGQMVNIRKPNGQYVTVGLSIVGQPQVKEKPEISPQEEEKEYILEIVPKKRIEPKVAVKPEPKVDSCEYWL